MEKAYYMTVTIHFFVCLLSLPIGDCETTTDNFNDFANSTGLPEDIDNFTYFDYDSDKATDLDSITETSSAFTIEGTTPEYTPAYTESIEGSSPSSYNEICTCDLTAQYCDVNCCCDDDCSEEDVKVFTGCLDSSQYSDDRYCYRKNIFYKNNTVYKGIIEKDGSMFCIVVDNVKHKLNYKNLLPYESPLDIKMIEPGSNFSWSFDSDFEMKPVGEDWKAGDLLLVMIIGGTKADDSQTWGFPSGCFGSRCDCVKPVHYMEDMSSSCVQYIEDFKRSCESNPSLSIISYSNFCIQDNSQGSSSDSDISNDTNPTDFGANCISLNNVLLPKYDNKTNTCHNVVDHVRYDIVHSGSHGINSIKLNFSLTSLSSESHNILQKFLINFTWNHTHADSIIKRSGNPGYRIGYPILSGTQITKTTNDSNESGTMTSKIQGLQPLSILNKDASGLCSSNRRPIPFKKNMKSGCLMNITFKTCNEAKEKIHDVLLGKEASVYVGAFGNSNSSHREEWVEIFSEGKPFLSKTEKYSELCELSLNLQINIAYASVGPLVNPQSKIVGVLFKFGSPQSIHIHNSASVKDDNTLLVSSSVHFYDVSESAVSVYKKFPVFDVKLPHDFFYPFLLSASDLKKCHHVLFASQICFIILLHLSQELC